MINVYRELRKRLGFGDLWMKEEGGQVFFRWFPDRDYVGEWTVHERELEDGKMVAQWLANQMREWYRTVQP